MKVKSRDMQILELATKGPFQQKHIPWFSTYQGKMRRLRQLCEAGLLEMDFYHRQRPNRYSITEKGKKVFYMQREMLPVKRDAL